MASETALWVLSENADPVAAWAATGFRLRGLEVLHLTSRDIASARGWRHEVIDGRAQSRITLATGEVHESSSVAGVLNRLGYYPYSGLFGLSENDRGYAWQEMQALLLSWLHAVPARKLNPPTPQGLCGTVRRQAAWAALCHGVGLNCVPLTLRSDAEPEPPAWNREPGSHLPCVIVVGKRAFCPSELEPLKASCVALARACGSPLIQIDFIGDIKGLWRVQGVSVLPDLRRHDGVLDALMEEFQL